MTTKDRSRRQARMRIRMTGPSDGSPVVLLPGFRSSATTWHGHAVRLGRHGYRVYRVDLRGHGRSTPAPDDTSIERAGRELHRVIEAIGRDDLTVIGHSMGASTLWSYLQAYRERGRVGRIVHVDQTPKMLNTPDWPFGYYGYTPAEADTFFARGAPWTGVGTPFHERGVRSLRMLAALEPAQVLPASAASLRLLRSHAGADWRAAISATTQPVLFVAGAQSEAWPAAHAAAAASLASRGDAVVIPRCGHLVHLEQPDLFFTAVSSFIPDRRNP